MPADVAARPQRLAGLDGVRGLAALFVVVNHLFLRAFPGYPVDRALRQGAPAFLVSLTLVLALTIAFARLFAPVFETPFLRHRAWSGGGSAAASSSRPGARMTRLAAGGPEHGDPAAGRIAADTSSGLVNPPMAPVAPDRCRTTQA